jgi:hypothetical protein
MADELEKILADEETPAPVAEVKPKETEAKPQEPTEEEQAVQAAKDELVQLGKAKADALAELSRIRKDKQALKRGKDEEEELPKIDLNDPSAKAWDRHMTDKVTPVLQYEEKAREEVRSFALQKFLQDKPALAKDPEKVKKLVEVYERLHTATERTTEGVLMDLDMAYGAITYREREDADYQQRVEQAQADTQFAEAAISKGATGYQTTKPKKKVLTDEEKVITAQWEAAGAPKLE